MTRAKDGTPADEQPPAAAEQAATAAPTPPSEPAPTVDAALFEPFPGADFFHTGRTSPIVAAAARRLVAEGCWASQQRPGQDWTRAHQKAFAAWQETLRPKGAGNVSGRPDEVSWDKLHVPRATPTANTGRNR